jgi:hypothetical protein
MKGYILDMKMEHANQQKIDLKGKQIKVQLKKMEVKHVDHEGSYMRVKNVRG